MSAAAEMVCVELVEVITDYLEGALPAQDRERFEAHLAACGPCRRYVEQFRCVVAAVGRIDAGALPESTREELARVFRGWRAQGHPPG